MRIVYIIGTLASKSGANRIITEKANYFATKYNHDVTIITCFQPQKQANIFTLSSEIKQINLSIPYELQYHYKYPMRLWVKWKCYKRLCIELNNVVNNVDPDILIGVAQFKADIVSKIKCKAKKVIECHEARNYTLSGLGMNRSLMSRVFLKLYKYKYFRTIEHYADVICTLTKGDKELWKKAKRIEVIPNFSTMQVSRYSDCKTKRIIAVGRFVWEKGYSRLFEIWRIVSSRHPDWELDIFGEGDMEYTLKMYIKKTGLINLTIHKYTSNISLEYAKSSIFLLTSYYEGFSLVLLEAQRHGVPCVAFDCPFGPRSIINDSKNGFLVEDGDIRLFADRVCYLIENEKLRKQFAQVGLEHVKSFDVHIVIKQWEKLFKSLTEKGTIIKEDRT